MAAGFSDTLRRLQLPGVFIAANVAVFIVAGVVDFLTDGRATATLALPGSPAALASRPWTLITYMFAQAGVLHLLFNMLWLYCFDRIMTASGSVRSLPALYLGGGLAGAAVFLAASAMLPATGGVLIGSSASVLAVGVGVAFRTPDLPLSMWPLGMVKLKWIVLAIVVLFCIGITGTAASNAAHLGGAAFGAAYSLLHRRMRKASKRPADMHAELDALLDRVKISGYASLSPSDKRRLFELSYKLKK